MRTKVINHDALNIPIEDVQDGAILIVTALLNKEMDKPFIAGALQKQVKPEGPSVIGTSDLEEEDAAQTHETTKKKVLPTSAFAEDVNTGIHLNLISNNNLTSSNFPLMKKSPTPTPPQSPKPLSMSYVTSFPQHSSESDTITIYQML